MGAEIDGVDNTTSEETSWEGTPTRLARVRIETSELKAEAAVPASQTHRLLTTILDTLVVLGAVLGPALTLQVVPAAFPAGVTAGTIAGQLAMLALVARSVRRREERGPLPAS
ncbi:hypothetical protein BS329_02750 [Amycolatopsis coloradensis]|uniref:Uncharacterized protein n=1 Tax=Amycolatopsis coloradensis TaxID=76021 RepID=A0A1R0L2G4_9PSEU|nr:hypothetical protein [Amycolatopsis coloradensis]OLZ56559.1 hypothetical protein BS329_02750 [Amycolatopsis coloradensis]